MQHKAKSHYELEEKMWKVSIFMCNWFPFAHSGDLPKQTPFAVFPPIDPAEVKRLFSQTTQDA